MSGLNIKERTPLVAKELLAGGAAGSIGVFFGVPFDLVKVRMQTMPELYPSPWQCFLKTVKQEGFFGLFRGSMAPIVAQIPTNAVLFASESAAMRLLEPNLKSGQVSHNQTNHFMAGMFGGICQCIILVPTDVIKCKMQVEGAKLSTMGIAASSSSISAASVVLPNRRLNLGPIDFAFQLFKAEGIFGLYKGFGATAIREVPSIGVYFSIYKFLRERLGTKTFR